MISFVLTFLILSCLFLFFIYSKYYYILENIYGEKEAKYFRKEGTKILLLVIIFLITCSCFLILRKIELNYFTPVAKIENFDAFDSVDSSKDFLQNILLEKDPQREIYQITFVSKTGNFVFQSFLSKKDVINLKDLIMLKLSDDYFLFNDFLYDRELQLLFTHIKISLLWNRKLMSFIGK